MGDHSKLPSPPFHHIPGLANFRDIGGYPVNGGPSSDDPGPPDGGKILKVVRPGLIYRSSEPSRVTTDGVSKLQALRIEKVYDLRSNVEIERGMRDGYNWNVKEWDGALRVFAPVFLDQDFSPESLAIRYGNFSSESPEGFVAAYEDILTAGASSDNGFRPFKTILEHLASPSPTPPSPCLIHCTAGKDRTGVICALILSLCGVDDEIVAHEYSLTDLGLKSRHDEFIKHLMDNPVLRGNPLGAKRMVSARKDSMLATLAKIRETYGSVEKCVVDLGLLSSDNVRQLQSNLIVELSAKDAVPWQDHAELLL
ncbi:tyrosine phosphatase family-domain-containing protein [Durotheca rogersii]|uniref:tyrosine phosphatase family-domain-containing protein n=1 Tax=Durotheca rogersii TaxID=419775 RepID=UPI00221E9234|nr:tyrosine phosphatase family-domain-containing protein [Durotheca rogersii]KAI5867712.1 tyrosine phosphatase family-domain-containing protein [Durotheca rogersii]